MSLRFVCLLDLRPGKDFMCLSRQMGWEKGVFEKGFSKRGMGAFQREISPNRTNRRALCVCVFARLSVRAACLSA